MWQPRLLGLLSLLWAATGFSARALELPASPPDYIFDDAGVFDPAKRQELRSLLSAEDLRSGNQVLVASFHTLEDEDPVDYTNRLFKLWNPGQKGKNNGVLLAVFMKEHKIRIEVGYGLEPVLTDALSKRIIETVIKPRFREGEYTQGLIEGSKAIVHTLQTGDPGDPPSRGGRWRRIWRQFGFLLIVTLLMRLLSSRRSQSLGSGAYRDRSFDGISSGGFGDDGGSDGGFSGGGGESGGGGSSGDW